MSQKLRFSLPWTKEDLRQPVSAWPEPCHIEVIEDASMTFYELLDEASASNPWPILTLMTKLESRITPTTDFIHFFLVCQGSNLEPKRKSPECAFLCLLTPNPWFIVFFIAVLFVCRSEEDERFPHI